MQTSKNDSEGRPKPKTEPLSIPGAVINLCNVIVGAGILGTPYAILKTGLAAGIGLLAFCAVLTEKSLNILFEAGQIVNATSYEGVAETIFGVPGFYFVSINMLLNAYGTMVSYLVVIKDSLAIFTSFLSIHFDIPNESIWTKPSTVLVVFTTLVLLPLCCLREMKHLEKSSAVSIVLDAIMVGLILYVAPIQSSLESAGGLSGLLFSPDHLVHWNTLFSGLGVFSFAFVCQQSSFLISGSLHQPTIKDWPIVCQHSSFLIAGSLHQPTIKDWSIVTRSTLMMAFFLTFVCGTGGYIGFQDSTQGDILRNFPSDSWVTPAAGLILAIHMTLVFPMESFVARHISFVFLRRHRGDGDDNDNKESPMTYYGGTVLLYLLALATAILAEDLGIVLSITGAVSGSLLAYVMPGMIQLGAHGEEFMKRVNTSPFKDDDVQHSNGHPIGESTPLVVDSDATTKGKPLIGSCGRALLWYITFMPLWYGIAERGSHNLSQSILDVTDKVGDSEAAKPISGQQVQTTTMMDFGIAIGFISFGLIALTLGLVSTFFG